MKLKIATLVGVLALVASSAFAGNVQWLALNGGVTIPSGDLSDYAGAGEHFGASYGYGLTKNIAVGADVNYHMFGKKTVENIDIKPKVTQFDVAGYYMFPMKDMKQYPYVKLAVGAYSVNPDVTGAETKTKLGVNGGVGYNYNVNEQWGVGADALYHWISTGSDYKKTDGSNATFSAMTVGIHVGYAFGAPGGGSSKSMKK